MYLVGVINAIMYLVRLGNYNIPRIYGINLIFHRKRNVAAYIEINLAVIVNMCVIRRVQRTVNIMLTVFRYRAQSAVRQYIF